MYVFLSLSLCCCSHCLVLQPHLRLRLVEMQPLPLWMAFPRLVVPMLPPFIMGFTALLAECSMSDSLCPPGMSSLPDVKLVFICLGEFHSLFCN